MSVRVDAVEFLSQALSHSGKPYIWGAKGPHAFDCSGLVTYVLRACGGPDWRDTHNAALLFQVLDAFHADEKPHPGCLVFYGPPRHAQHVMLVVADGRVFGACGGDSSVLTYEDAIRRGARVRFRDTATYRPDVLGMRRLPERAS